MIIYVLMYEQGFERMKRALGTNRRVGLSTNDVLSQREKRKVSRFKAASIRVTSFSCQWNAKCRPEPRQFNALSVSKIKEYNWDDDREHTLFVERIRKRLTMIFHTLETVLLPRYRFSFCIIHTFLSVIQYS